MTETKKTNTFLLNSLLIFSIALLLGACSSAKRNQPKSAEEAFAQAMVQFNNGEYLESQTLFDAIKLQYPASQFADDAQYYLAEASYMRSEFVTAVYHYTSLRRIYPRSEFCRLALYKTALSYYQLSPSYDRDQEYTRSAINSFQEFIAVYPEDSLSSYAKKYIVELREKLGHRDYFTAGLYRILRSPASALIYYESVIDNYPDTEYLEPSYYGKIEMLVETKKIEEAKSIIELYNKLFPNGTNIDKVKLIEAQIKK